MWEQLKNDRIAQLMLVVVVIVGFFACLMVSWAAYLYINQNRPLPVAPLPATSTVPQPTPTYTLIPELEKKSWKTVDIRALVKNPEQYTGQQLHYRGEVFSIEEDRRGAVMQVWVNVPGSDYDREAVVVVFRGRTENVYQGTEVEFWGYGTGTFEGTNAFGVAISQPIIEAEHLTYFTN